MGKITVSADQEFSILSAADRCDQCGSQAYVLVILPGDLALTFSVITGTSMRKSLLKLRKILSMKPTS